MKLKPMLMLAMRHPEVLLLDDEDHSRFTISIHGDAPHVASLEQLKAVAVAIADGLEDGVEVPD